MGDQNLEFLSSKGGPAGSPHEIRDGKSFEDAPTAPMTPSPIVAAGAPLDEANLIGKMVGEYQVTGLIGEGGMGTVYSGVHPVIGKRVAIKVLKPALSTDAHLVSRFVAEARAVNQIGHPNIVDIFSFGKLDGGAQYFVMEYLSGQSLYQAISSRSLGCINAYEVSRQILGALQAAHNHSIVHRDLKPENIFLVDHPGGGHMVKILDFGIAKFMDDASGSGRTQTGLAMGTPYYMSPEQCRGRGIDHRSDLYSIGVILYEVFAGQLPFQADSVNEIISAHMMRVPPLPSTYAPIPEELERIIMRCLEKDPAKRPQSVSELKRMLLPVLKELPSPVSKGTTPFGVPAIAIDLMAITTEDGKIAAPLTTGRRRIVIGMVVLLILAIAGFAAVHFLRQPAMEITPSAAMPIVEKPHSESPAPLPRVILKPMIAPLPEINATKLAPTKHPKQQGKQRDNERKGPNVVNPFDE